MKKVLFYVVTLPLGVIAWFLNLLWVGCIFAMRPFYKLVGGQTIWNTVMECSRDEYDDFWNNLEF